MAYSLLATSVTPDCVNHEICRRNATYRHGAQVKDVPVMSWLILRCGAARKEVRGKRLFRVSNETPPRLLSDLVEHELS